MPLIIAYWPDGCWEEVVNIHQDLLEGHEIHVVADGTTKEQIDELVKFLLEGDETSL